MENNYVFGYLQQTKLISMYEDFSKDYAAKAKNNVEIGGVCCYKQAKNDRNPGVFSYSDSVCNPNKGTRTCGASYTYDNNGNKIVVCNWVTDVSGVKEVYVKCSKTDPDVCPNIGGQKGEVFWAEQDGFDPFVGSMKDLADNYGKRGAWGRTVKCRYDTSKFDLNEDVLTQWENNFSGPQFVCPYGSNRTFNDNNVKCSLIEKNIETYNKIASNVCFEKTTNCKQSDYLKNYTNNQNVCKDGLTGCAYVHANTPLGDSCSKWFDSDENKNNKKTQIGKFCGENVCAIDCLCINNTSTEEGAFIQANIKSTVPSPDPVCWWGPCSETQSSWQFRNPPESQCPNVTICAQTIQLIENKESVINVDNRNTVQQCGGDGPIPATAISFWNKYKWIIIGVGSAFVVILIIILIVFLTKNSKNKKQPLETYATTEQLYDAQYQQLETNNAIEQIYTPEEYQQYSIPQYATY